MLQEGHVEFPPKIEADVLVCPACKAQNYALFFYFLWTCGACGTESNYVEGVKARIALRKEGEVC